MLIPINKIKINDFCEGVCLGLNIFCSPEVGPSFGCHLNQISYETKEIVEKIPEKNDDARGSVILTLIALVLVCIAK